MIANKSSKSLSDTHSYEITCHCAKVSGGMDGIQLWDIYWTTNGEPKAKKDVTGLSLVIGPSSIALSFTMPSVTDLAILPLIQKKPDLVVLSCWARERVSSTWLLHGGRSSAIIPHGKP